MRINAEDPAAGFAPRPGRVEALELPTGEGIRVDTHLRTGDLISPHYDSMVCKLIAHGADRQQALDRAAAALDALTIRGVTTTAALHRRLLDAPALRSGDYDTTTLETWLAAGHGN